MFDAWDIDHGEWDSRLKHHASYHQGIAYSSNKYGHEQHLYTQLFASLDTIWNFPSETMRHTISVKD